MQPTWGGGTMVYRSKQLNRTKKHVYIRVHVHEYTYISHQRTANGWLGSRGGNLGTFWLEKRYDDHLNGHRKSLRTWITWKAMCSKMTCLYTPK